MALTPAGALASVQETTGRGAPRHIYTPEQQAFVVAHFHLPQKELVRLFAEKFGTVRTERQVQNFLACRKKTIPNRSVHVHTQEQRDFITAYLYLTSKRRLPLPSPNALAFHERMRIFAAL